MTTTPAPNSLADLPEEIILEVVQATQEISPTDIYDGLEELCTLATVSSSWRKVCESLMKHRFVDELMYSYDVLLHDMRLEQTRALTATGDVSWRAAVMRWIKTAKDEDTAWVKGNVHIRWVPHLFGPADISLAAVSPFTGELFVSSDEGDGLDLFTCDKLLQPAPGTPAHGFTRRTGPKGSLFATPSVDGMGPVVLVHHPVLGHSPPQVEVWVTPADADRWTALDLLHPDTRPPAFQDPKIAETDRDQYQIDGFEFLAAIQLPLDLYGDDIPPLDTLVSLHVDHEIDGGGAQTLVYAFTYEGTAYVRAMAVLARLNGEAAVGPVQQFDHRMGAGLESRPVVRVYLDNDFVFVADERQLKVFLRRSRELIITLDDNSLKHNGPKFSTGRFRRQVADPIVSETARAEEIVPNITTVRTQIGQMSTDPPSENYHLFLMKNVLGNPLALKPGSLRFNRIDGGTLLFVVEDSFFVLRGYLSAFGSALRNVPEKRMEDDISPRLVEVFVGDNDFEVRLHNNVLLFASTMDTFLFDIRSIPAFLGPGGILPRFAWYGYAVESSTRTMSTGVGNRFLMSDTAIYEVVEFHPGGTDHWYVDATDGFPDSICLFNEDPMRYAIRVLSVLPHDKFKGQPPEIFSWEVNYEDEEAKDVGAKQEEPSNE